ncbi:MAG: RidA family protein [Saprospiraceae bacterium]
MKTKISSGAKWEDIIGYSRAVRVGNVVEVAGTTAAIDGEIVHIGDAYLQAKTIFGIIESALQKAGAKLEDVVRTRIFLKNPDDWQVVGKAHGEVFKNIKPSSTMVVAQMIHPDMLVEIEATAIVED